MSSGTCPSWAAARSVAGRLIASSHCDLTDASYCSCSDLRGGTVPFATCLNLTRPQFAVQMGSAPRPMGGAPAFRPKLGPAPVVPGQHFRAGQQQAPVRPVAIMSNPSRGRPGNMHYGGAAKGTVNGSPQRPANGQAVPHQQILRNTLAGSPARPQARPPPNAANGSPAGANAAHARPPNGHTASPSGRGHGPRPHRGARGGARPVAA